jgi:vancomycin permeability regulator SanA
VLVLAVLVLGPPVAFTVDTQGRRFRIGEDPPAAPVAIVLGAGLTPSGQPSFFLTQRVTVAARLYHAGKVRALLMSGDNSRSSYDEVTTMADLARDLGVPAGAIVTDHAGFDTYSSCYRARSVWGISRAVVVTQPFHLARAVGLCRALGVDAVGVQTDQINNSVTWYGWVREVPAMDNAAVDLLRGRRPRFPGPREHALDGVNAAG